MSELSDLLTFAAIIVGLVAALAAGGLALLRSLRSWSITVMLAVVAVVTVASTLAGVAATALTMFFSLRDHGVVLVLVGVGGLVGLVVALLLGRSVLNNSRALRDAVRAVDDDAPFRAPFRAPGVPLLAELAELSRELESAHLRLGESRARERALETSRRELVAWVSHDLRTPLAGLRAMAEGLESRADGDPAAVAQHSHRMRSEIERLTEMVDDLFELTRVHAGAFQLSRRQMRLDDLVAQALVGADPSARAKGVRLSGVDVPEVPVQVDAEEMGRALRNLVVDAIRHAPDGGTVEVLGAASDGSAYLTVSDGCGGARRAEVGGPFDVTLRDQLAHAPGTEQRAGFGLAIARGIVEAHAGEIDVADTESGCRFIVRLPLRA